MLQGHHPPAYKFILQEQPKKWSVISRLQEIFTRVLVRSPEKEYIEEKWRGKGEKKQPKETPVVDLNLDDSSDECIPKVCKWVFSDILQSRPKPFSGEEPVECLKAFTLDFIFRQTICLESVYFFIIFNNCIWSKKKTKNSYMDEITVCMELQVDFWHFFNLSSSISSVSEPTPLGGAGSGTLSKIITTDFKKLRRTKNQKKNSSFHHSEWYVVKIKFWFHW